MRILTICPKCNVAYKGDNCPMCKIYKECSSNPKTPDSFYYAAGQIDEILANDKRASDTTV
jgi:hypothetical protein